MAQLGHIKLSRKLFRDDPWWGESRAFSRFEAWVDVLQLAAWRATSQSYRGESISLARGELLLSVRHAADRWNWSEKAVRTWLKQAHRVARIETRRETHAGTVYHVVNYDAYQRTREAIDTPEGTEEVTPTDTEGAHQGHKKKQLSSKALQADTARSTTPERAPPVGNPVAVLGDWWLRHVGGVDFKQLGAWSKSVRSVYSLEQIQAAALVYWSEDEGPKGYRSAKAFFDSFVRWHETAMTPPVDSEGNFTSRGRKILGAA